MNFTQRMKFIRRVVTGKNKYYPKDLIPHLTHSATDCENCKNAAAEQATISLNVKNNGGQYKPGSSRIGSRN